MLAVPVLVALLVTAVFLNASQTIPPIPVALTWIEAINISAFLLLIGLLLEGLILQWLQIRQMRDRYAFLLARADRRTLVQLRNTPGLRQTTPPPPRPKTRRRTEETPVLQPETPKPAPLAEEASPEPPEPERVSLPTIPPKLWSTGTHYRINTLKLTETGEVTGSFLLTQIVADFDNADQFNLSYAMMSLPGHVAEKLPLLARQFYLLGQAYNPASFSLVPVPVDVAASDILTRCIARFEGWWTSLLPRLFILIEARKWLAQTPSTRTAMHRNFGQSAGFALFDDESLDDQTGADLAASGVRMVVLRSRDTEACADWCARMTGQGILLVEITPDQESS